MKTQAEYVIDTFGGPAQMAKALGISLPTVYRWTYPLDKGGSDGLIPTQMWPKIRALADDLDIELTCDHFVPINIRLAKEMGEE